MSYPKDLDEYTRFEISQELARREGLLHKGQCDYCCRSGLTNPCKFPERHKVATEQAKFMGHKLCGKQGCDKLASHTAYGSLTYAACDEHNNEIQTLVAREGMGIPIALLRPNDVRTFDDVDRGRFV